MRDGYTDLPPGKIAAVVTYLEMRTPPAAPTPTMSEFDDSPRHAARSRLVSPALSRIGEPWLWFSRLRMSDDELRAMLHDPAVDVFALSHDGEDHGLLEFDRRHMPDIEIAFFGVTQRDDRQRRGTRSAAALPSAGVGA